VAFNEKGDRIALTQIEQMWGELTDLQGFLSVEIWVVKHIAEDILVHAYVKICKSSVCGIGLRGPKSKLL